MLTRRGWISGIVLIVALLALWEAATRAGWIDTPILPPVTSIVSTWFSLIVSGTIPLQLGISLLRVAAGFLIAAAVGIALGLVMGHMRAAFNLLEPLVELLRPIPSPAYIPVAILFLGLGESMKVFVIAFSCMFPILLNTYGAIREIDPVLVNTGRTFGVSRIRMIRSILLPAALPGIFTGLRVSLGIALIVVVIAEMIASQTGIGYFILNAQRLFEIPEMFAGIFTLALIGYALNKGFLLVEARLLRWQPTI